MNYMMTPQAAALASNFANYANGIKGTEKFMTADLNSSREIVIPAGSPAPEFVPPCDQSVTDLYTMVWTNLKK